MHVSYDHHQFGPLLLYQMDEHKDNKTNRFSIGDSFLFKYVIDAFIL